MNKFPIFWVAIGMNNNPIRLVDGPFLTEETAENAIDTLPTPSGSWYYIVVESEVNVS